MTLLDAMAATPAALRPSSRKRTPKTEARDEWPDKLDALKTAIRVLVSKLETATRSEDVAEYLTEVNQLWAAIRSSLPANVVATRQKIGSYGWGFKLDSLGTQLAISVSASLKNVQAACDDSLQMKLATTHESIAIAALSVDAGRQNAKTRAIALGETVDAWARSITGGYESIEKQIREQLQHVAVLENDDVAQGLVAALRAETKVDPNSQLSIEITRALDYCIRARFYKRFEHYSITDLTNAIKITATQEALP